MSVLPPLPLVGKRYQLPDWNRRKGYVEVLAVSKKEIVLRWTAQSKASGMMIYDHTPITWKTWRKMDLSMIEKKTKGRK